MNLRSSIEYLIRSTAVDFLIHRLFVMKDYLVPYQKCLSLNFIAWYLTALEYYQYSLVQSYQLVSDCDEEQGSGSSVAGCLY